jgi:hypothetical protein
MTCVLPRLAPPILEIGYFLNFINVVPDAEQRPPGAMPAGGGASG